MCGLLQAHTSICMAFITCLLSGPAGILVSGSDQRAVSSAEDRVLWYSAQYRDWDVTNGSVAQEVRPQFFLY